MKNTKFSCLMSCYYKDSVSHLTESLNSIYNQTLAVTEIILVKDGALTKELNDVISRFSSKLPIKILQLKANKGLGNALHLGLEKCSYNYVIRMDTDDICEERRFEKLISFLMINDEIDIVGSWAQDIDNNGVVKGNRVMPLLHKDIYNLIWTCPLIHPTVAFKKDSILSVGSYSTVIKRRQDYDLWFRAASAGLKFANIPEYLLKYRFTESFYKKNDLKVAMSQSRMGLKGLFKLRSKSIIGYLGVFSPVFRAVFPDYISIRIHEFFKKNDPRKRGI